MVNQEQNCTCNYLWFSQSTKFLQTLSPLLCPLPFVLWDYPRFHNIVAIVFPRLSDLGSFAACSQIQTWGVSCTADCVLYAQNNSPEFSSYNIHYIHFFNRWAFWTKISKVSHSICKEKKNNQ